MKDACYNKNNICVKLLREGSVIHEDMHPIIPKNYT